MWKKLGRGWVASWLKTLRKAQSLRLHNIDYAPHGSAGGLSARSLEALRILQWEPRGAEGPDIVAQSDGLLSRASVYLVLGDLEEQGLVRAKRVRKSGRLPRARYSITARGVAVLTEFKVSKKAGAAVVTFAQATQAQ